jgi:hypothetical protein
MQFTLIVTILIAARPLAPVPPPGSADPSLRMGMASVRSYERSTTDSGLYYCVLALITAMSLTAGRV